MTDENYFQSVMTDDNDWWKLFSTCHDRWQWQMKICQLFSTCNECWWILPPSFREPTALSSFRPRWRSSGWTGWEAKLLFVFSPQREQFWWQAADNLMLLCLGENFYSFSAPLSYSTASHFYNSRLLYSTSSYFYNSRLLYSTASHFYNSRLLYSTA